MIHNILGGSAWPLLPKWMLSSIGWKTVGAWMLLSISAASVASAGARRKVIIDQDAFGPGGSNMQAILLVIQSPEAEVVGITIESGDGWCAENVAHTLRLLEIIGRTDIPVIAGATFPLLNSQEETKRWENRYGKLVYKGAWMEGATNGADVKRPKPHGPEVVPRLPEGEPKIKALPGFAADFLIQKAREFPGEISVVALGPLTNLALAVRMDDAFAKNLKDIYVMGGSFSPHPAENSFALEYMYTPRLEFNFRWDPEAAQIVLHASWKKIVLIPTDPTTATLFTKEMAQRATTAHTPLTEYVAKYAEAYPLWDELAAAVWLDPAIVARQEILAVDVETDHGAGYGNTIGFKAGHGPAIGEHDMAVVFSVDVPRFNEMVIARLNAPTPKP